MAATSKKPASQPAPRKPAAATAPVIAPDVAFGNVVTSTRDAAVVAQQALHNDRATREQYYEREQARLTAARDAELTSIDQQIMQQGNILSGCDAALEALRGGNVVPLRGSAAA